jgi:dynein heavy chain
MPFLPLYWHPQVFGLHANADISYYTSSTKDMWSNLVDLQPRVGRAAGGISREAVVAGIACDISAKIPEQFDLPLLAKGLGVPTPPQVVLLQELTRWNGVLDSMSTSLKELQRALSGGLQTTALTAAVEPLGQSTRLACQLCGFSVGRHRDMLVVLTATHQLHCLAAGEIGFSAALEELSSSLFNGKLPPAWARLNPATEKALGSWMAWFTRRHQQYKVCASLGCGALADEAFASCAWRVCASSKRLLCAVFRCALSPSSRISIEIVSFTTAAGCPGA